MKEILPEIYATGYCYYIDIVGAFVTACIWIVFNKVLIGVSFCYGSRVTRKNVFYEYSLVWLICILNIVASVLIIILFCSDYYSDNDHRKGKDMKL